MTKLYAYAIYFLHHKLKSMLFILKLVSSARLNLREKHARHVADIRAYYEAEIDSLKKKLDTLSSPSAIFEAEKHNQNLSKRFFFVPNNNNI